MTDTTGFMTLEQAKTLKPKDRVRVLCGGGGEAWDDALKDDRQMQFLPGEIVTVTHIDTFAPPQNFAITIVAENGVVNVFDESDFGGLYPFERVA